MCPNCYKKNFIGLIIFTAIVAISLTSINLFASSTMDEHEHKTIKNTEKRKKLSEKTRKEVVSVLVANETLHNAFFKYDGMKVEEAAESLKSAISKISEEEISKLLKFSQIKLSEISSKANREDNNKNYHLVSMALIHIVNKYDVGEKYNAYSCPMVKKKWVQNSSKMDKVHNPYAPEMPHCGTKDSSY